MTMREYLYRQLERAMHGRHPEPTPCPCHACTVGRRYIDEAYTEGWVEAITARAGVSA
jgi:hypothetical protein